MRKLLCSCMCLCIFARPLPRCDTDPLLFRYGRRVTKAELKAIRRLARKGYSLKEARTAVNRQILLRPENCLKDGRTSQEWPSPVYRAQITTQTNRDKEEPLASVKEAIAVTFLRSPRKWRAMRVGSGSHE
ncbi:hypothetical protein BJ546DRAFT_973049 [Cryomyces antarcticus]